MEEGGGTKTTKLHYSQKPFQQNFRYRGCFQRRYMRIFDKNATQTTIFQILGGRAENVFLFLFPNHRWLNRESAKTYKNTLKRD